MTPPHTNFMKSAKPAKMETASEKPCGENSVARTTPPRPGSDCLVTYNGIRIVVRLSLHYDFGCVSIFPLVPNAPRLRFDVTPGLPLGERFPESAYRNPALLALGLVARRDIDKNGEPREGAPDWRRAAVAIVRLAGFPID